MAVTTSITSKAFDGVVLGLGASAGGLDALKRFFAEMPTRPGAALVVVQHMEAGGEQLLTEALLTVTSLPVRVISDDLILQKDCVYVAPAGCPVEVDGTRLILAGQEPQQHPSAAIDHFFYSLAEARQSDAVGIVFSGTGSDGALGLKAISEAGGMTMVQEPASARFDAMPRNGIAAGMVDHVLPPEGMPQVLNHYLRHLSKVSEEDRLSQLREQITAAIPEIARILQQDTEHDFQHYKTNTLIRRVQRRMQVLRTSSTARYLRTLGQDADERAALFRDLLIGVTAFFRDPEAFDALGREVLDRLITSERRDPVRIWVAGCASGEEAYTIAILCRERMDRLEAPPEVQIFATDIDERALRLAREGRYPEGITENVDADRLERYFFKRARHYHVSKEIRELCLFSLHNVISDPPFSRLDLISCRNLLIYLGPHLQNKLIPLFHYALRPEGYLFLGASETVSAHPELFRTRNATHRLSQRKPVANTAGPAGNTAPQATEHPLHATPGYPQVDLKDIGQRIVLDEFAPEWAIVNDEAQIVTLSAQANRFLQLSGGTFHNNIFNMARSGLRVGLRTAFKDAQKNLRRVDHEDMSIRVDGGVQRVMLTVQPMPQLGQDCGLFMIVFHEVGTVMSRGSNQPSASTPDDANALIEQLERELRSTRDDLERTVQDLEVANEELKSSNEELLSMNEELQSANEELETSKEQVQYSNQALAQAKSDLENLLRSTEIATLFLDGEGCIQRFTPAVTAIYNIIDTDVGRPLWHLTHRARQMPKLPSNSELSERDEPTEEMIETLDGHWYARRVLPYRDGDGKCRGSVITFSDVTSLEQTRRKLQRRAKRAAVLADLGRAAITGDDPQPLLDKAVQRVSEILNHELCKVLQLLPGGSEVLLIAGVGWESGLVGNLTIDTGETQAGYTLQSSHPVIVTDLRSETRFAGPTMLCDHGVVSGMSVIIGPPENPWGVLGAHSRRPVHYAEEDVHFIQAVANILWQAIARQTAQRELKEKDQRLHDAILAGAVGTWTVDLATGLDTRDAGLNRILGTGETESCQPVNDFFERIHPDDQARAEQLWQAALANGRDYDAEMRIVRPDGGVRWIRDRGQIVNDDQGEPSYATGAVVDITEHRLLEQRLRHSEQRLQAFLDNAPPLMGVVELPADDSDVLHLLDNTATERFFGVGRGGTAGRWARRDLGVDQDTIAQWAAAYRQAQHSGEPGRFSFAFHNPEDNERFDPERWLDVSISYMGPGDDGRDRFCYTAIDETERVRVAEALREADRHKDDFIAMLAHELRNPLAPIRTATQVFEIVDLGDKKLEDMRDTIKRQVDHMTRLLDDLLDVSRIARGRVDLQLRRLDLCELVQASCRDIEATFHARAVQLSLQLPAEPLFVRADTTRLSQAVGNLLSNALKFTEDGGRVDVELHRVDREAKLVVRDSGIGMDPEFTDYLFQPFRQADRSLHRSPGGLGLGLSIVKGVVDIHGGSVQGHSAGPGEGAEFIVYLPLEAA